MGYYGLIILLSYYGLMLASFSTLHRIVPKKIGIVLTLNLSAEILRVFPP